MREIFKRFACWICGVLLLFSSCEEIIEVEKQVDVVVDFPEHRHGLMKIDVAQYTKATCDTMFLDNEPSVVSFNNSLRQFYVNKPLQVSINGKQELHVKFYSPRPIAKVEMYARLQGYNEFFKLAEYDTIPPFHESHFALPFITESKLFRTESGKVIEIMRNPYISQSDLELKVVCNDPYYKKLETIKPTWSIYFSAYSLEGSWTYPILPLYMREAVAIALNMGYMYSTAQFEKELYSWQGKLLDGNNNPIDTRWLLTRVYNQNGLCFGHCTWVNGLGGGNTFGLNNWCYLEHYANDKSITHTIFHELGHCLGYGHSGNMTYGDGWTKLCGDLYEKMSRTKELPVYSRYILNTRQNRNGYHKDFNIKEKYPIEE